MPTTTSTVLRRTATTFTRHFFTSKKPTSSPPKKPPLLYTHPSTTAADTANHLQLLSWGRGSSGQLGVVTESIRLYPAPLSSLLLPPSFRLAETPGRLSDSQTPPCAVGISSGLFHSAVVVDGLLWVWGKGDGGRLGLGHEDSMFGPKPNGLLEGVRMLALGGLHSVALTSLGQIFTWGYGGFGALGHSVYTRELVPRMVQGPWSDKIKHIATSGTHTAAITESGELYTWGREEGDGRLGLGPERGPDQAGGLSTPGKVKALPVPVAAVACGGFFTMALTEQGQLWCWGANANYELGTGDKVGGWRPRQIPSLEKLRVVQVACGGYHTLALTDDGKVRSWGHGGRGQLGHSSIQNEKVPKIIEALAEERVISIACGGTSSAAVTATGNLYMWGNAKDSQLGVPGLPDIQSSPVQVNFLTEDDGLGPHRVLSVAVGASHAICLVSRSSSSNELTNSDQ
ncbi:hypothetical protein RND81_02G146500 [Saponaria officinalis]|uniref:RCC1-like domain-containing protein n=1 Tax=Saponaria officinalis TaxID=3572 RepID=A0AAW1MTD7_SAPOF